MFCSNCGKKIPDNAKFCMFCGIPVVFADDADEKADLSTHAIPDLVPSDTTQEKSTENDTYLEFSFGDRTVRFDNSFIAFNNERIVFMNVLDRKVTSASKPIAAMDVETTDPDTLYTSIAAFNSSMLDAGMEEGMQYLLSNKIYDVSREQLAAQVGFDSERTCWSLNLTQPLREKYAKIVYDGEASLAVSQAIHDERARWSGGGFGVKAALKGAVTAGALNVAGGIVSGTISAISKGLDRSIMRSKKTKLLKEADWLSISKYGLACDFGAIFEGAYAIVTQKTGKPYPPLNRMQAKALFENAKRVNEPNARIDICLAGSVNSLRSNETMRCRILIVLGRS